MDRPAGQAPHVKIPLLYFLLASTYIVVSTAAFGLYFDYGPRVLWIEVAKGMGFVLVTAVILWGVLYRQLRSGRLSEARFHLLVENLPDAVFLLQLPDRRIVYANPAARQMFGYEQDELVGATTSMLHVDADHFSRFQEEFPENSASGDSFCVEFEMRRKCGEVFPTSHVVSLFAGETGETYAISVVRDESELRRREAELRQAQKMEAVGQLTGGIAHDFNNLLTVILGNAEMLRESMSEDDEQQQDLRGIIGASRRGASLTQRLLAFSRQQILSPDPVELNALVSEMTELLGRTLGEHVEIETRLEPELWPVTADRAQLETSIMNLAINARDAMPEGGRITLETANVSLSDDAAEHAGLEPGDYVRLRVADTGFGMPAEILTKAFDPFFTTKQPGKGTGLGLSTVYGFVKQSGGSVDVQSEPGQGTTFEILLPRRTDAGTAAPEMPPESDTAPTGSETALVVEDDPMVRAFAVRQLRAFGYTVLEASSGNEALDVLDTHPETALLFTDIVMPGGVNGAELAVTAQQRYPGMRVLFTSGYAEIASLDDATWPLDTGMLRKPYTPRQLGEAVRRALDRPS